MGIIDRRDERAEVLSELAPPAPSDRVTAEVFDRSRVVSKIAVAVMDAGAASTNTARKIAEGIYDKAHIECDPYSMSVVRDAEEAIIRLEHGPPQPFGVVAKEIAASVKAKGKLPENNQGANTPDFKPAQLPRATTPGQEPNQLPRATAKRSWLRPLIHIALGVMIGYALAWVF
jgi:hypothetical protein